MLASIVYLLLFLTSLLLILLIYLTVCLVHCFKLFIECKKNPDNVLDKLVHSKIVLNILVFFIMLRSRKILDKQGRKKAIQKLKKMLRRTIFSASALLPFLITNLIKSIALLSVLMVLALATNTALFNSGIFSEKNKNCKCYAKCTGNEIDDEKCSYELIFGPEKFRRFIRLLEINREQEEILESYLGADEFKHLYLEATATKKDEDGTYIGGEITYNGPGDRDYSDILENLNPDISGNLSLGDIGGDTGGGNDTSGNDGGTSTDELSKYIITDANQIKACEIMAGFKAIDISNSSYIFFKIKTLKEYNFETLSGINSLIGEDDYDDYKNTIVKLFKHYGKSGEGSNKVIDISGGQYWICILDTNETTSAISIETDTQICKADEKLNDASFLSNITTTEDGKLNTRETTVKVEGTDIDSTASDVIGSHNYTGEETVGRLVGDFLITHLNTEMVKEYRSALRGCKNFRKDGLDRFAMSDEELKQDLIKLLSDYKIHGKNPNCDCFKHSKTKLKNSCMGAKHWKRGWFWVDAYDADGNPVFFEPGSVGNTTALGHATGQYAVTLGDGLSYYWYHQSKCTCANNVNHPAFGRYSELILGSAYPNNGAANYARNRGCSSYATAMALSNVLGMEITPFDVVTNVLGGTIGSGSAGFWVATPSSSGIEFSTGSVRVSPSDLANSAVRAYGGMGLTAKQINLSSRNELDAALDKGGMVVTSVTGSFEWYNNPSSSHYIVIRKRDQSGLYYCLDSASHGSLVIKSGTSDSKCREIMNRGIPWESLSNHLKRKSGIVFYGTPGKASGGSIMSNAAVKAALEKNGYAAKAQTLSIVYEVLTKNGYSHEFAVGMMANVQCEGDVRQIEGDWGNSYWDDPAVSDAVRALALSKISSKQDVETLLTVPGSVPGIGIGMVQWSGGRRPIALQKYLTLTEFTDAEGARIETEIMIHEFTQGDYTGVPPHCNGKSAGECAGIICLEYEKPKNKATQAVKRTEIAEHMASIL